jgi:hypothetical protein
MIDVFVSRPTWIPAEFREGLDGFLGMLKALDLSPRTLGATDYPTRAPLDEVITLLDQCGGAVILGYPQILVHDGIIKGSPVQDVPLATEWNHIEAGLAYARELPLLIIHHLGIGRGIFDRGAVNSFIYECDLMAPQWPLASDIRGSVSKWKEQCVLPAARRSSPEGIVADKPYCPNCSMGGRRFWVSPIPTECTKCRYKGMYPEPL